MKPPRSHFRHACRRAAMVLVLGGQIIAGTALAQPGADLVRTAESFDRHYLSDPSMLAKVRAARNLSGGGCCVSGWFEYDFDVKDGGWYGLTIRGNGNGVEFLVDPDKSGLAAREARFVGGSGQNLPSDKIGNIWLTTGRHRIRLQRHYWTGFPSITAVELRPSSDTLADSVAVAAPDDGRIFRKGQCPALEIVAGGMSRAETLHIAETDPYSFVTYRRHAIQIPASAKPTRQRFALPCGEDGYRMLWFGDSRGAIPNEKLRGFAYEVVDTQTPVKPPAAQASAPLLDIDCAARTPDYSGGGPTRVVHRSYGAYRESGDTGWTRFQRAPEALRRAMPEPSWFAYTLPGLRPQQRYRIEVRYPDDAWRTFGMVMREAAPLSYPVGVGVDTGGEFRRSHELQAMSMTVWPRAAEPRLTFMTAHDGSRAACSQIRVYAAEEPEPIHPPTSQESRRFINWQEEGGNFASLFGPPDETARGQRQAAERWAEAAAATGANTLMPTVLVYSFALYPSRTNLAFSKPGEDTLRRLVLAAEKHRLTIIPELHPRADELAWDRASPGTIPDNVLIDKAGRSNFLAADGKTRNYPPYFNPLAPKNQDWYLGLVGELADRYKDSPAFEGISLRFMQWANPALNNLVSLDWGYDDSTVALFKRETGSAVPLGRADDPGRFAARHAWLTNNGRKAWIDWRCRKIADLTQRIRDRVRQARPDLKVYLNLFGGDDRFAPDFTGGDATLLSRLREAGLDPTVLGTIDGVVLLNASSRYGRREADALRGGYRDALLDPASLGALRKTGVGGQFLSSEHYLEATDAVVPPERLGFAANTKRTWASLAANPPGRLALERFATELAETDATTLGDGGNAYSFGPPIVREFMETYRRLPARRFTDRADASDPVAVRTLAADDGFLAYAVNRERYPIRVDITLGAARSVQRLADGSALPLRDNHLLLDLKPYELVGFRSEPGARIDAVRTDVPADETRRLQRQIAAVERAARPSPVERLLRVRLAEPDYQLLKDAANEARRAFTGGNFRRARTVLEHSALLAVYKKLGCYPPGLLDADPEATDCDD